MLDRLREDVLLGDISNPEVQLIGPIVDHPVKILAGHMQGTSYNCEGDRFPRRILNF